MSDFLITLHQNNPFLVALAYTIAAIWGLVLYFTRRPFIKTWRTMLVVAMTLGMLQALLGLLLIFVLHKQPPSTHGPYYLHYVYGGIVALGIPLTWIAFTTNGKEPRKDILYYSIAALILLAAAARAWMTGYGL